MMIDRKLHRVWGFLLVALALPLSAWAADDPWVDDPDPARFADAIAAFEREDQRRPWPQGETVIVGSSSVRMLDEEKYFPGVRMLNRGFGGAHLSDVDHYLEQTVLRHQPKTVVMFCGNNDLWSGKPIDQVKEDFQQLTSRLFERLPESQLIVLALRPSPKRIRIIETELAMNRILERVADEDDRITYVAGSCDRFLDHDGAPIQSLYADDRLHMSDDGYAIWSEILAPQLTRSLE